MTEGQDEGNGNGESPEWVQLSSLWEGGIWNKFCKNLGAEQSKKSKI